MLEYGLKKEKLVKIENKKKIEFVCFVFMKIFLYLICMFRNKILRIESKFWLF